MEPYFLVCSPFDYSYTQPRAVLFDKFLPIFFHGECQDKRADFHPKVVDWRLGLAQENISHKSRLQY